MRLAVIVLSYNTCDLLRQCLQSLLASIRQTADRLQVDILVVDNASPDGSAAMVATEFPQVHLFASPTNLGYTGGNNLALQQLGFAVVAENQWQPRRAAPLLAPDFVLLLNADTEIVGDALWQMANALSEHPQAGACGAHLIYGNGQFQHGAFRFPSLLQVLIDFFPLTGLPGVHRLHNSRLNGRYRQRLWSGSAPFVVDFVLGAAMMVRSQAIEQVGGLDNEFFMYCEEMDWALRLQQAGWQILAVPTARVIHHEGQSSRQVRWTAYERLWRSRFRFYQKHRQRYSAGYLWFVRLLVRLGLQVRSWQALRRFIKGQINGVELEDELQTYAVVAKL